jgi:tRNA(fMet)-specific endonuclease VapC
VTGFLLDTNVLSELAKKRPVPAVVEQLRRATAESLFTSSVCVMELRFGAARHPNGQVLWQRLRREILSRVRVLALGEPEAVRAGEILADLEGRGQRIGVEDVLIAATALTHRLTLATRNVRHLGRVKGLDVRSWWD